MRKSPTQTLGLSLLLLACCLMQGCYPEVESYRHSWVHQAHGLQRQLDQSQPLARATFIATHNSYNSGAYTTPQSYTDPNQYFSLTQQLDMDVRALELDVHSFYRYDMTDKTFHPALLLCHGTDQHIGCSPFDRTFVEGLTEIQNWLELPQHQHEVVLLYVEDHANAMDNEALAQALVGTLGQRLYLPDGTGCHQIPSDLSKADVLAAGKQILVISDGCSGSWSSAVMFGGFADSDDGSGYPTVGLEALQSAPDCIQGVYEQSASLFTFIRMQEDRTLLTNLVGNVMGNAGRRITAEIVPNLLACEINLIGLDKLHPNDGRLQAAIWSWAEGQPRSGLPSQEQAQCARHNQAGRFEAADCAAVYGFACRDRVTAQWSLSDVEGSWHQGEAACTAIGMEFDVPFSGYDNLQLQQIKLEQQVETLWLGYGQDDDGHWQVNGKSS